MIAAWEPIPTSIVSVLAIYGATLSTIALLLSIRRDILDRHRLRVVVGIPQGRSLVGDMLTADVITFEIINSGRLTMHVRVAGGRYVDGRPFSLEQYSGSDGATPIRLPLKVEPTERVLIRTVLLEDPMQARALSVWDTLGKEHRAGSKEVREVQRRTLKYRGKSRGLSVREWLLPLIPFWIYRPSRPSKAAARG